MPSQGEAIIKCKCPKCREGDMFETSMFRNYFNVKMPKECPKCGQTYRPEPGFFFGAMYVSYGFSVATMITVGVILYNFFGDPDMWVYMTTVIATVAILWPIQYRLSRSIFFNVFGGVDYDPSVMKSSKG
ncbi:DUF983 domain-containing protein [Reichenbachiella versicolor]|uniref:DUF983 domain-containing protein n=1 Tax=Reichenbachiella versicolor TaxID=1821036 RepID=UPI000D6DF5B7|nr:DUF983 domain-containing protein [Reichenbachiella versicolor]